MWCGRGHSEGMAELGAEYVRRWWRMDMNLAVDPTPSRPVRRYALRDGAQVAGRSWSDLHNRSFADHWRFSPSEEGELGAGRSPHPALFAITAAGAPAALAWGPGASHLA